MGRCGHGDHVFSGLVIAGGMVHVEDTLVVEGVYWVVNKRLASDGDTARELDGRVDGSPPCS